MTTNAEDCTHFPGMMAAKKGQMNATAVMTASEKNASAMELRRQLPAFAALRLAQGAMLAATRAEPERFDCVGRCGHLGLLVAFMLTAFVLAALVLIGPMLIVPMLFVLMLLVLLGVFRLHVFRMA